MGLLRKEKFVERRKAVRRRVLWGSRIARLDGSHYLKCQVHDISSTGTRVQLEEEHLLLNEVYFLELKSRLAYEARIVWRTGHELGLQFLKAYRFDEVPSLPLRQQIEG